VAQNKPEAKLKRYAAQITQQAQTYAEAHIFTATLKSLQRC